MTAVIDIETEADWTAILGRYTYVVAKFGAPWCGPCKAAAPRFEALAREYPDTAFVSVNVDELGDLAGGLGVESLPTFVFVKAGNVVDKCGAADMEARVRSW